MTAIAVKPMLAALLLLAVGLSLALLLAVGQGLALLLAVGLSLALLLAVGQGLPPVSLLVPLESGAFCIPSAYFLLNLKFLSKTEPQSRSRRRFGAIAAILPAIGLRTHHKRR